MKELEKIELNSEVPEYILAARHPSLEWTIKQY